MKKREFLNKLHDALLENMDEETASYHVKYYSEYIDSEVAKGKSEKEVIKSLNNPRLIAKNIIDNQGSARKYKNIDETDSFESMNKSYRNDYNGQNQDSSFYDDKYKDNSFGGFSFSVNGRPVGKVGSIVGIIIAVLLVIVMIALIFAVVRGVFWLLFRVLVPVALVVVAFSIIYRIIKRR